ncbi:MAG TPA: hypothetical protein VHO24_06165 [Opitutaceae bacterium]|nr:hypothetical protein [Opitutaceae bacterium]
MAVSSTDLRALDGKIVLVKSAGDFRNPPTAVRGTIAVRELGESFESRQRPEVHLVLSFPDMFNRGAHQHIVALDDREIERLVASGREGTYEFALDRELE